MESSNNAETWQQRVRRLYKKRGFTQDTFGEKLGKGQSTLNKWLGGSREPRLADFEKMAELLSTEDEVVWPGYLIFGPMPDAVILRLASEVTARLSRNADELSGDQEQPKRTQKQKIKSFHVRYTRKSAVPASKLTSKKTNVTVKMKRQKISGANLAEHHDHRKK